MTRLTGDEQPQDTIELRLPLKEEYLAVLRATTGVIAGTCSFSYDEVLHIRVAVTEVFNIVREQVKQQGGAQIFPEIVVRFTVKSNLLEIVGMYSVDDDRRLEWAVEEESQALLESLMDEVEFGAAGAGETSVRLIKYKS